MNNGTYIGRLAPSPTGLLHVGNAFAFLIAWLDARKNKGKLILRMEDIDPDRSRKTFAEEIKNDLAWLGLDWDEEVPPQSKRLKEYDRAVTRLLKEGHVYPCFCSRKELRSLAGAPHVGDTGAPYPGTCRRLTKQDIGRFRKEGKKSCLRLRCEEKEDAPFAFKDRIQGEKARSLKECGGDFPLVRSDGVFAYQLAVVLDDINSGVTHVVRGCDILESTPRQLYLYELFEKTPPVYAHLPLIVDQAGDRLAKRHASVTLKALREKGMPPEKIWGILAKKTGLKESDAPVKAADLVADFKMDLLRTHRKIFFP